MKTYKHNNWLIARQVSNIEPCYDIVDDWWNTTDLLFYTDQIKSMWFELLPEIVVPESIRFMSWWTIVWLEFWDKEQILYYNNDAYQVSSNIKWWRAPVKAKVVESNYKDLEPWDWFVYITSINSKEGVVVWWNYAYYMKVSDSERVHIEWRWIVVTNWWTIDLKVYKVVFMCLS